jgi:aspartate kinase
LIFFRLRKAIFSLSNITILDIITTCMTELLFLFQSLVVTEPMQFFSIFEDFGISVDCVATSEVSISLTLWIHLNYGFVN